MTLEKTKRIYIVILIIALFASLAVIFYFLIYPDFIQKEIVAGNNNVQSTAVATDVVNSGEISDKQQLATGTILGDFENCQADPEGTFKKENVSSPGYVFFASFLALAKKDLAACAQAGANKDGDGFTCEERYLLGATLVDKNGNCTKIANKELSLSCQANQQKDVAICAQISDTTKRATCEAIVNRDTAKCGGATLEQKGECVNTVNLIGALNAHDLSLCAQINNSFQGGSFENAYCKITLSQDSQKEWNSLYVNEVCLKNFVDAIGREKKDVSLCENIPNKDTDNKNLYTDCLARFE